MIEKFAVSCPIPIKDYPRVLLAHGGGGRLMHDLIGKMFLTAFGSRESDQHDAAVVERPSGKMAFTTDSFVVHPLFFPGGDIGSMAVHGTVNDLAMAGARPLYLSAGFIIEEGLAMADLWKIVRSMSDAARAAGVRIITGDTKVVDRGKGDGVFINTSGIGVIEHSQRVHPVEVQPGDAVVVNGDIGRHGMAIMAVREGLEFESTIESDSAAVNGLTAELFSAGVEVHCLRDLTRGGLASALNEIAAARGVAIRVQDSEIPVREDVRGACEILGFDPLYVACEGRFAAFVPQSSVERALAVLRAHPLGAGAAVIGQVNAGRAGMVTLQSRIGVERIIDMISGEQLPRIC